MCPIYKSLKYIHSTNISKYKDAINYVVELIECDLSEDEYDKHVCIRFNIHMGEEQAKHTFQAQSNPILHYYIVMSN